MSLFKLFCKDDALVNAIRETFHANPLRIPEERVQPLTVIATKRRKSFFRGKLGAIPSDLVLKTSRMANVSGKKTRGMDVGIGLSISQGFLKGFGASGFDINTALRNVKEVSFSFHNVQRKYVDVWQLGSAIKDILIDVNNPAMSIFFKKKGYDCMLIDSVITSSDFTINVEKSAGGEVDFEAPIAQFFDSEIKTGIRINASSGRQLSFEAETPLTFAFSCVQMDFEIDGDILAIEPSDKKIVLERGFSLPSDSTIVSPNVFLTEEPVLLEWETEEEE